MKLEREYEEKGDGNWGSYPKETSI